MAAVMAATLPTSAASEAASAPHARKLRVGIVAASRTQPRWVVEAFAAVAASDFAEIALIAETGDAPPAPPLVWSLYDRADRFAFARDADPSAPADLVAGVAHRRLVRLPAGEASPELHFALDVVFALDGLDEQRLEGLARYGVWRFHFGAGCPERLVGFREVADDEPLTASGLSVWLNGARRLAYQSWSRTYPLSPARTRAQVLEKAAQFPSRVLRELQKSGTGAHFLQSAPAGSTSDRSGEKPAPVPDFENRDLTAVSAVGSIARIGSRIARRGVEKALNVEQWFLAYRFGQGPGGDPRAVGPDLEGFTRLMPPADRYWADPFVLERNGRYFVFFEELPFRAGKAHISLMEIAPDGTASAPVKVLERDYHLSYPFILEHDGQLYMVPETARRGTVELYRCIDFPLRWRLERVLMEGVRCVDATFHREGARWWMFANVAAGRSRMFDDELHLFHAEDLLGEWKPHPANPVKSDARCARPAGQLYRKDGALYRPAQVCVPLYGAGLSINRVMRLTPHEYVERQVARVLPSRAAGLLGVHTVNRAGDLTVVDAFTRTSRF
jgi:hypothetical protein